MWSLLDLLTGITTLFQKSAVKPMQAPQGYFSAAPYVGSGAPSMYMGVPPYGSSLFNGTSVPPYDMAFSGGSAYHYNYGSRLSGGSPYHPLHLSAPHPYSNGSVMGNGILSLLIFCWGQLTYYTSSSSFLKPMYLFIWHLQVFLDFVH